MEVAYCIKRLNPRDRRLDRKRAAARSRASQHPEPYISIRPETPVHSTGGVTETQPNQNKTNSNCFSNHKCPRQAIGSQESGGAIESFTARRAPAGLSHTKCFYSRFAEVNSPTNTATYYSLLPIYSHFVRDKCIPMHHPSRGYLGLVRGAVASFVKPCVY